MAATTEDTWVIAQALAYVQQLHDELTRENGAPTLGTQNQAVEFILSDPGLRQAVAAWARTVDTAEATTAPRRRPPQDEAYRRVRAVLEGAEARAPFAPP
jgi:hypothetical protein